MKELKPMKKLTVILSLVLSLALFVGSLAEQTPPAETAESTAQVETAAEQDAVKAAVAAYKALKKTAKAPKKLDALKTELDAFVADGKLTQEQADLVLQYCTEKFASQGEKGARKQQAAGQPEGKGQQKQRTGAQAPNGKNGRQTRLPDSGTSEPDAASGATKKGK